MALIRQIRARAGKSAAKGLILGIGDDCALLRPGAGEELAVTTDLSIAGRHFLIDCTRPRSSVTGRWRGAQRSRRHGRAARSGISFVGIAT